MAPATPCWLPAETADTAGKVCNVYGDVWVGQSIVGNNIVHLTRLRGGKVVTGWPRRNAPPTDRGTEEAAMGKRKADTYKANQLSVYGNSTLATGGGPAVRKNYLTSLAAPARRGG